jgi:hypothetical protein
MMGQTPHGFTGCPTLTTAAIAAFQQARPDVAVTR